MQITGMLWGRKLLDLVEYPHSEVRGPELSVDDRRVYMIDIRAPGKDHCFF